MPITTRPFPNGFLIVPNLTYFFGSKSSKPLRIVYSFKCDNVATIHVSEIGAFGYQFNPKGELGAGSILETTDCGEIPSEVTDTSEKLVFLQEKRLKFANFVSAVIFGRLSGLKHSALTGAVYNGMDSVFGFAIVESEFNFPQFDQDNLMRLLYPKISAIRSGGDVNYRVPHEQLVSACTCVSDIMKRSDELHKCDIRECLVMNYQAAILHERHHFQASLALNFVALEALIDEVFFFYGLVNGHSPNSFCSIQPKATFSSNKFQDMGFDAKVAALLSAGLIDDYLSQRISDAKKKRNDLMHRGQHVALNESGNCQTVVRDILHLFIEAPFELNAGASYRL